MKLRRKPRKKSAPRKSKRISEHDEQVALIEWSKYVPECKWLFAVPNGARTSMLQAVRLKREGLKSGIADIMLPIGRRGFHGLWIEMKAADRPSLVSNNQRDFLKAMNEEGYHAVVCMGAEQAISVIEWYIGRASTYVISSPIRE
jgi:hypothetical protein